jgi:hypothetical protein
VIEMLDAMAYPTWVRSSPSIFAYTMINSLHAIGLAILVGTHTVVCLRLLGALKQLPLAKVRKLYPIMYTGMWINIFSGLSLFWASHRAAGHWRTTQDGLRHPGHHVNVRHEETRVQ